MIKETLLISPTLDKAALQGMDRNLNKRFSGVAKKFGNSFRHVIKGLGKAALWAGIGLMIAKIFNTIKEAEESINKTLKDADNIVTRSRQFQSSAGAYFKLQQAAGATGLDTAALDMMLSKFQVSLARARSGESNAVSAFTGEKDTVQAFFKFQQALKSATEDQRTLAQQEIFGERYIGRAAEFFQTDLVEKLNEIGGASLAEINRAAAKLAELEDKQAALGARRNIDALVRRGNIINPNIIQEMDKAETRKLKISEEHMKSFKNIQESANALGEINFGIQKIATSVVTTIPIIYDEIKGWGKSGIFRGIWDTTGKIGRAMGTAVRGHE